MPDPSEASRPDPAEAPGVPELRQVDIDEDEEGGGPVKSFLEHLEDLRWVLIKCATAVVLSMVLCLFAVNELVAILKWPLERAHRLQALFSRPTSTQRLSFYFGTNRLGVLQLATNEVAAMGWGTNRDVVLELTPVPMGDYQVLALKPATNLPPGETSRGPGLIFLDPAAPFMSSLHLAFFGGLLLASPFVLYFVAQFILPALKIKEKKYGLRAFGVGLVLFVTGVCFCYFGIMPFALRAAEAYSLWMGVQMPDWRAELYFSFVTKFMLGMGLGFELPVVLLALVKIGLLDYAKLAAMRRYMIVINLVLGALLTTPEVFTQVMMAVPLQVLYEIAVWIAWYWERKERKRAAAAGETPA